jgi:hypothetical protein
MTTPVPYHRTIALLIIGATLVMGAGSCAKLNISNYYHKHHPALDSIEDAYRHAYSKKPFSIEFTDRPFNRVSLELITDTLTYIYEYYVGEPRLLDTLTKYGYDTVPINWLIRHMRTVECTWIDKLDYYAEEQRHSLIYLSLWPRSGSSPFINKKYYILAYFQQAQSFDSEGRLLTSRRRKHVRKINANVYFRLNDRTAYTISDRFR